MSNRVFIAYSGRIPPGEFLRIPRIGLKKMVGEDCSAIASVT